ncbi:MAG: hypothetical protein ACYDCC_15045 [Actinomycetota bacterium]
MTDANRNAPLWVTALLVVLAVACVAAAIVYFIKPAGSLPSFFPGHVTGSDHHHTKHGIAGIGAAVVLLILAWITSGKKKTA